MLSPDLLVTKFTIPPIRSMRLPREHLLRALEQSRTNPLTLLSASAGFGKTTLLSAWARQTMSQVAWVTLDEQDNDPTHFWAYVIAALRKAGSPVGEATLAMLHSPQPSTLPGALTALINELASRAQEVALILDDYHLIREPAIHESLRFVLDHLPACMHVLLASRVDPPLALARLRARGQVVEIREMDLRLRGDEAAGFLTQVMDLPLSMEAIRRLEQRTEGWIAGLQLAALSLRRHHDASAFVQTFTGNHRLILDYVQEEILDPLPEAQQRFLLHTSVLERMNAEVCQRLSGESTSQQILEALERANLFLIPFDEERRWYRWHTLFREVLLARLQATQPDLVPRLHREAALWYQQQGWLYEAISHARASQDFWFMAELLEGCVERLHLQGELKTLLNWIKLLPQEVLSAHPHLATSYILAFNMLSPFSDGEENEYLTLLWVGVEQTLRSEDQATLSQTERDRLHHRMMILQAWKLGKKALSDDNVEQLNSLVESLQHLSLDDDTVWKQQLGGSVAMALRLAGNFPPMVATLQEMRKMTRGTQDRYQEVQTLWGLIGAMIALGQLSQAQTRCQEFQQLVNHLGAPLPAAAYPHFFQAQLAYAWNQLEIAKSEALIAIEKTTPLHYLDILMGSYEVLGRCCIAQGNLVEAEHAIHEMEQVNKRARLPLFLPGFESLRAQLWLAQGDLVRAVEWAKHIPYREVALHYNHESAYLTLVRIYLATQQYPQALQWLAALLGSAERVGRGGSVISILALQVAALQASGATQEARSILSRLLIEAEPEDYRRIFLDVGEPMKEALLVFLETSCMQQRGVSPPLIAYAQTLLDGFACEQHQNAGEKVILFGTLSSSLPEPLTPREQEVLCLLASGASNQEIANRLVVSLRTVKKHVGNLLLKLSAQNRTHAVARARELSLL
ncbi:LuxR C-terminal-related transcriptional regulator [Ktedonospora formicarum]|uniref:LuxR family transcriptional regulator n=1 Tax=Ktedonospora formicarum TaxID=2778364 RepID=A0A8J3MW62_9CHLR|nr:LuxR C-terminal-related transcriptional regulator [Ktedonospora formicarum]GHO47225.1 LuxR family transcriptional regulator [Ktedonospora formicarum]